MDDQLRDRSPRHVSTNDLALQHMVGLVDWEDGHDDALTQAGVNILTEPEHTIFALRK
jgi:hypothetical protein